MKIIIGIIMSALAMSNYAVAKNADIQNKPIKLTKSLTQKIAKLEPDSSNANDVELLLGKPTACLPLGKSGELWACQWKGDLSSSGILNTLNITFEAGMVTSVTGVDAAGNFLSGK